jgi:hypothetical protein
MNLKPLVIELAVVNMELSALRHKRTVTIGRCLGDVTTWRYTTVLAAERTRYHEYARACEDFHRHVREG